MYKPVAIWSNYMIFIYIAITTIVVLLGGTLLILGKQKK